MNPRTSWDFNNTTAGGDVQSLSDSADAESSEPEVKTQSELDEQLKDLIDMVVR